MKRWTIKIIAKDEGSAAKFIPGIEKAFKLADKIKQPITSYYAKKDNESINLVTIDNIQ
jgi:hypothetical protein